MLLENRSLSYRMTALQVKRCHPAAKLPQQNPGDVGFDISCVEKVVLAPKTMTKVRTGLCIAETPEPLVVDNKIIATPFAKIEGRSGLASRGIFPVGGIVDPSYRGEIQVVLFNSNDTAEEFEPGSRVAQLVIYYVLANVSPHSVVKFVETDTVEQTQRGDGGFGSSGT